MIKKSLVFLLSTILSLILLEISSRLVFRPGREGVPTPEMFQKELNKFESIVAQQLQQAGCTMDDWYLPHPFYDMLFQPQGRCGIAGVNRLGFRAAEYPLHPDPGKFRILVLGASVAEFLASFSETSFLARALTERALGPNGEQIEVYSGAIGGWRLPNQEIVFNRFITQFDAVLAIDGYNEFFVVSRLGSLLTPNNYYIQLYVSKSSISLSVLHSIFRFLSSVRYSPLLRESVAFQALHFLFSSILNQRFREFRESNEFFRMQIAHSHINGDPQAPRSDFEDAVVRFAKYSKMIHATSKALGRKSLHVIQPGAFTGKLLVGKEKEFEDPKNGELYRKFVSEILKDTKGYPTFSLIDIFENDGDREVYVDPVHFHDNEGESYGNKKLADAISELAIRNWNLKRK